MLDESNEEVPIENTECQKAESNIERKDKENRRVGAKRGIIAAMILALAACCIFWYMSTKKEPFLDLHGIQGEENTPHESPEFNLDWS